MAAYKMESCVRGYHIYKDLWDASIGEDIFNKAISEHMLTPCTRIYIRYNFQYEIFSNVILFRVFKFRKAATHTKFF